MKHASKEILTAAIGITAGAAVGILISKVRHKNESKGSGEFSSPGRRKEKLIFVRNKLEKHRERLDRHLARINSKIETLNLNEEEIGV